MKTRNLFLSLLCFGFYTVGCSPASPPKQKEEISIVRSEQSAPEKTVELKDPSVTKTSVPREEAPEEVTFDFEDVPRITRVTSILNAPASSTEPTLSFLNQDEFDGSLRPHGWWSKYTASEIVRKAVSDLAARGDWVFLFHEHYRRMARSMPSLLREIYFGGYSVVLMKAAHPTTRSDSKMLQ